MKDSWLSKLSINMCIYIIIYILVYSWFDIIGYCYQHLYIVLNIVGYVNVNVDMSTINMFEIWKVTRYLKVFPNIYKRYC